MSNPHDCQKLHRVFADFLGKLKPGQLKEFGSSIFELHQGCLELICEIKSRDEDKVLANRIKTNKENTK